MIGPIGGAPPLLVSTVQPTISGEAKQGSTLKVTPGTWSPVPESFSYQWARCNRVGRACAPIKGATAETHEVGAGDLGHALVAIVQARSGATSQAVFSVATAPAVAGADVVPVPPSPAPPPVAEVVTGPLSSAPPHVAVVVQQGRRLTGAVGSWSGTGAIKYAYRWYRCNTAGARCKSIPGATSRTYTLVAKDVGQTIGFGVRATDKHRNHTWVCEPRRAGRGTEGQARLDQPADGHRRAQGGPGARGLGRQLEPEPGDDRVPVAALQSERAPLQAAPRSDREHLRCHGR